jgi:heme exporter protein A
MSSAVADPIQVAGVSKSFGSFVALHQISFSIPQGCMALMAGSNGAGKSTLLRLLAGLGRPSSGRIHVNGADPVRTASVRRRIGLLSHYSMLYEELTAAENLHFAARLYGLPERDRRIDDALEGAGLLGRANHRVRNFSRGMKQRLALTRATLHEPSILLLDEPFSGLDQRAAEWLTDQLREILVRGCSGVLVTHQMESAVQITDRLLILRRGRICFDAPWERGNLHGLTTTYRDFLDENL